MHWNTLSLRCSGRRVSFTDKNRYFISRVTVNELLGKGVFTYAMVAACKFFLGGTPHSRYRFLIPFKTPLYRSHRFQHTVMAARHARNGGHPPVGTPAAPFAVVFAAVGRRVIDDSVSAPCCTDSWCRSGSHRHPAGHFWQHVNP